AGKNGYGFEVLIPTLVRDGREHELGLRVKGEAGSFFRLKPRSFLCPVSDGLDPAAMGRQGKIEFWIDVLTEERISGWACKPEEPGIGLTIYLFVDGKPEAAFHSFPSRRSSDLAGKNGYGFEVLIPPLVRDGREHELVLRVKGEAGPFFRLKPRSFLCPVSDGLDPAAMGRQSNIEFWIAVLTEERISGWACKPEAPALGRTIELLVDGKLVLALAAQQRRSALFPYTTLFRSFEVLIPPLVRDGREHELGLRVKGEAGPFFRLKPRRFLRWAL